MNKFPNNLNKFLNKLNKFQNKLNKLQNNLNKFLNKLNTASGPLSNPVFSLRSDQLSTLARAQSVFRVRTFPGPAAAYISFLMAAVISASAAPPLVREPTFKVVRYRQLPVRPSTKRKLSMLSCCFPRHPSLTMYIYIYIYIYM